MKNLLLESLSHMDMENMVKPELGIDKYESAVGTNDDVVTIDFMVKSAAAANDLAEWFERGYDWVIDADCSPGEVKKGYVTVFVEMNRRSRVPERIIEMLDDLEVLTGYQLDDWKITIKDQEVKPTVEAISAKLEISPKQYRETHPDEENSIDNTLKEWCDIAGVNATQKIVLEDESLRALKIQAGLI
jgi:hypothetical protein